MAKLEIHYEAIRILNRRTGRLGVTFSVETPRGCERYTTEAFAHVSDRKVWWTEELSQQLCTYLAVLWADTVLAVKAGAARGRRERSQNRKDWALGYQAKIDELHKRAPRLSYWALAGLAAQFYQVHRRTILRNTRDPRK